tara:strand:- start:304207 stop:304341 length:135 start_codon:yes stop_codon:yes gene_type:complete
MVACVRRVKFGIDEFSGIESQGDRVAPLAVLVFQNFETDVGSGW